MDLGLKGKRAIVTGGTRGIGRAIASLLAAEGCDIAICARQGRRPDRRCLGAQRVKATGGAVDVADLPALRGWIDEAAEALGGLDIFVANVSALAQGMDEASWRRGFEIDVMGTVFGIEAALPLLEKSDAGSIVVVGSTAMAEIYGPNRSYAAVKATLVPYVKGLARNLAAKNVRANIVSPGNVFFEGGVWDIAGSATRRCSRDAGAQSDRAHGDARGGGQRGGVPGKPARQLHHRHQPDHRRCADPARAVLTVYHRERFERCGHANSVRRRIARRHSARREHLLSRELHLPDGIGTRWAVVDDELKVHGLEGAARHRRLGKCRR